MSNESNINTKDFLIGALVGGAVGAISALMLAPKSGKEIRGNIGEQSELIKRKSSDIAQYAKEKSSNVAQTVSSQSNQVANKVRDWKITLTGQPTEATIEPAEEEVDELETENDQEQSVMEEEPVINETFEEEKEN